MNIGKRLITLMSVQGVVLVVVGLTALVGLNFAANTTSELNESVVEEVRLSKLSSVVNNELNNIVNGVYRGTLTWNEGGESLKTTRKNFDAIYKDYISNESKSSAGKDSTEFQAMKNGVVSAFDELSRLFLQQNRAFLTLYVLNDFSGHVNPFINEIENRIHNQQELSENEFVASNRINTIFLVASIVIILVGIAVSSFLGYLIFRSITNPISIISETVSKVSDGDYYARTEVVGSDELGELGQAFDHLLEDKVATLVRIEKENTNLNMSIIALLQAVSKISQRDLTIKVPVTEDVTGPVADALNVLTSETSKVLQGVQKISEEVAQASAKVKAQSDEVISVAAEEQVAVINTAQKLSEAASAMGDIANMASDCNNAAENAMSTTQTAMETVNNTVQGINGIRETIHETEKRIKRLGERSQEISRAVNLINSISERTHILALNASMHAASAGEAGRGFAVVADEVQRLAENARDATAQISTLVSNIQVETSDTVGTMNNVISQVVEGSRLAELAGENMQKTKESTSLLVDSVRQIATNSNKQADVANSLQVSANQIKESTQKTSKQLQEQTHQTNRLVQFAKGLLGAVQVFKLPQDSTLDVTENPTTQQLETLQPELNQLKAS